MLFRSFGVNETLKFTLNPAASDTGNVGEANAKYLVDTDAPLMVTALFPELVTMSVRLLVVLGLTFPKFRLALPRTRFPVCWLAPPHDQLTP